MGELERRMEESRKAITRTFEKQRAGKFSLARVIRDFAKVAVIVGIVFACYGIYSEADESGWVPHTKVVTVVMHSSQWIAGEYRPCTSASKQPPKDIAFLYCIGDLNESHDLKVTFWGQNDSQRDRIWICQRSQALIDGVTSLSCKLQ